MDKYIYKIDNINIAKTDDGDLDFVLAAERNEENSPYVAQWSREQHIKALNDPDILHVLIKEEPDGNIGYAILAGLESKTRSIELKRLVIVDKGRGLGRASLESFKSLAFKQLNAHRLWLDVREGNDRARHLYKSVGFFEEGLIRDCILIDGKFKSHYIMSILEHEYNG